MAETLIGPSESVTDGHLTFGRGRTLALAASHFGQGQMAVLSSAMLQGLSGAFGQSTTPLPSVTDVQHCAPLTAAWVLGPAYLLGTVSW